MKQLMYNPNHNIRVTALEQEPPFYSMADKIGREREDPLGALREMDSTLERKYGVKHCRVVGFELNLTNHRAPAIITTQDELIVDMNPPALPA